MPSEKVLGALAFMFAWVLPPNPDRSHLRRLPSDHSEPHREGGVA